MTLQTIKMKRKRGPGNLEPAAALNQSHPGNDWKNNCHKKKLGN